MASLSVHRINHNTPDCDAKLEVDKSVHQHMRLQMLSYLSILGHRRII